MNFHDVHFIARCLNFCLSFHNIHFITRGFFLVVSRRGHVLSVIINCPATSPVWCKPSSDQSTPKLVNRFFNYKISQPFLVGRFEMAHSTRDEVLKLIARDKLTFDERVVVYRAVRKPSAQGAEGFRRRLDHIPPLCPTVWGGGLSSLSLSSKRPTGGARFRGPLTRAPPPMMVSSSPPGRFEPSRLGLCRCRRSLRSLPCATKTLRPRCMRFYKTNSH